MTDRPALVEALAAWDHEAWSRWTSYLLDHFTPQNIARWKRQIATPYAQLSEREQSMDRKEAEDILRVLAEHETARCSSHPSQPLVLVCLDCFESDRVADARERTEAAEARCAKLQKRLSANYVTSRREQSLRERLEAAEARCAQVEQERENWEGTKSWVAWKRQAETLEAALRCWACVKADFDTRRLDDDVQGWKERHRLLMKAEADLWSLVPSPRPTK